MGLLVTSDSACSITRVSYSDCESSDQCRLAFGVGYVCAQSGLCEARPVPARVVRTEPEDLFDNPEAYGERPIVGTIVDFTLETHQARADSVIMAVEGANDAGGITDVDSTPRPIAVIVLTNEPNFQGDQLTQAEASVAAARALVETYGARVIVGPPSSSSTTAVFQDLEALPEEQRPVVLSMSATSNSLTDLEPPASDALPGLLWRTAPPDVVQADTIVADMSGRGLTSIAIVYESGPYGEGLAAAVQEGFEALSGTVSSFPFTGALVRDDVVAQAGAVGAEEVLFISSQTSDATAFLLFVDNSGAYDVETLFLTDGAANTDLITSTTGIDAAVYASVRGTRPAAPSGPVYDTFRGSFNARNVGLDADELSFTAHSYDAGWLSVYGMAWALYREPAFTGRAVARGLRHVSSGTAFEVRTSTWPSLREQLRAGNGVDVTGASGTLDYDPVTEETTGAIEVWCIDTGTMPATLIACP